MTPAGPRPSAPVRPAPVDRRAVVAGAIVLLGFALVAVSLVGLVLLGRNDAAGFEVAARPAPPLELDRPGRPTVHAGVARRPAGPRVLRLHALSRRLPGEHRPDRPGARGQPGRRAGGVRVDRPRARRRRRHEGLPAVPAGGVHGPDRRAGRGAPQRRRVVGAIREGGGGARLRRVRHVAHVRHLPGRRRGPAPGLVPVRDAGRADRGVADAAPDRASRRRPMPAAPSAAPSSAAGSPQASARGRRRGDVRADANGGSPAPRSCRPASGRAGRARSSCRSPTRWACRSTDRRRSPSRWSGRTARRSGPTSRRSPCGRRASRRSSYVATVDIPSPGSWRLDVTAGASTAQVTVDALDPGGSAPLGGPAPDVDTPTLADAGGNLLAISTQPQSDVRLTSRRRPTPAPRAVPT